MLQLGNQRCEQHQPRPEPGSPPAEAISYLSPEGQRAPQVSPTMHLLHVLTSCSPHLSSGFSTFVLDLGGQSGIYLNY